MVIYRRLPVQPENQSRKAVFMAVCRPQAGYDVHSSHDKLFKFDDIWAACSGEAPLTHCLLQTPPTDIMISCAYIVWADSDLLVHVSANYTFVLQIVVRSSDWNSSACCRYCMERTTTVRVLFCWVATCLLYRFVLYHYSSPVPQVLPEMLLQPALQLH